MKKVIPLLLFGLMLVALAGCSKSYTVSYSGATDLLIDAKDSYKAREEVTLKVRKDNETEVSVLLDGNELYPSYGETGEELVYKFVMPEYNISITVVAEEKYSDKDYEGLTVLASYTTATTGLDTGNSYDTVTIYDHDKTSLKAELVRDYGDKKEHRRYYVPYEMIEKLSELAVQYDLENWDKIMDFDPIDGAYISFNMNYDNHKFMVSTEQMPSDGMQILGSIWNTIVNYLDNATMVDNW